MDILSMVVFLCDVTCQSTWTTFCILTWSFLRSTGNCEGATSILVTDVGGGVCW